MTLNTGFRSEAPSGADYDANEFSMVFPQEDSPVLKIRGGRGIRTPVGSAS